MNTRKWLIASGTMALTLLAILALAAGLSQAQEPGPETKIEPSQVEEAAAVSGMIPIQGRLTDASDNPLNGTYSIRFRLYDAATAGTALCEDTNSVSINDGLFYSEIWGNCNSSVINGQQLYLGIRVGSDDEMTPRQAIYPVPYAFSLRPGATISGTSIGALLHIENTYPGGQGLHAYATATSGATMGLIGASMSPDGYGGYFYNDEGGTGVYGESDKGEGVYGESNMGKGVYGESHVGQGVYGSSDGGTGVYGSSTVGYGVYGTSADGYGVYGRSDYGYCGVRGYSTNGTAICADGTGIIKSTAKSYLWISGNNLVKAATSDTTTFSRDFYGGFKVYGGSGASTQVVVLPVTIPGPLYGQNVTVTGLDLYYTISADLTGISATSMRRQNGVGTGDTILSDAADLTCTPGAQCEQHWDLTQNNVISEQQGILYIAFEINFSSDSDYVQIGGVRLTLEHD